jgi:hypothetical protein
VKTTEYFKSSVLTRRPYLKDEWIEFVLKNPIRKETQENGRVRYWAFIDEIGKHLRVVTECQKARQFTTPFQTVASSLRRQYDF